MGELQFKCPICGGTTFNSPSNVECVSLLFVEKGKQDININNNLDCKVLTCIKCNHIMLFKK